MSISDPRGRMHHETEWQVTTLWKARKWVPGVMEDQIKPAEAPIEATDESKT